MSTLPSIFPELYMGLSSLLVHKLRSLLTMLGMIFGVGAVVAMLSITAGAQKEMMSYIDLLGVNNIIIEAKRSGRPQRTAGAARGFAGPDLPRFPRHFGERSGHRSAHAPQTVQAAKGSSQDLPGNARCSSVSSRSSWTSTACEVVAGRFFTQEDNRESAPVCVLGESAKVNLLGYEPRSASTSRSTTPGCR